MNRPLAIAVGVVSALSLGAGLPSCPGQDALQQQVDQLQSRNAQLTKQVQALDSQVRSLTGELNTAKELFAQVSKTVLAHRDQLATMEQTLKSLAERSGSSRASGARKKGR